MAGKKRTSVSEYPTQPFIWIKQSKWQTILNIATLISVLITIGSILYTYRQNFNQNTVNKSLLDDNKLRLQENAQQIEDNNRLLERTMVILAGGPVDEELLAMMPPALIEKLIGETSSDGSSFLAGVSKQNLEELRSKFVNTSGKPYLNLGTTSIALDAQKAARASEKAAQSAGNAAKAALVILAGGNIDSDWLKTLSPELLTKLTEKGFLRYVNGQPYLESGTLRIALDAYDAARNSQSAAVNSQNAAVEARGSASNAYGAAIAAGGAAYNSQTAAESAHDAAVSSERAAKEAVTAALWAEEAAKAAKITAKNIFDVQLRFLGLFIRLDLDGVPQSKEAVVGFKGGAETGWVRAYNEFGSELWTFDTFRRYRSAPAQTRNDVMGMFAGDLLGDSDTKIAVMAADQKFFPTRIVALTRNGTIAKTGGKGVDYYHPGRLDQMEFFSKEAKRLLVFKGNSNAAAYMGLWQQLMNEDFDGDGTKGEAVLTQSDLASVVFAIDPANMAGEAPPFVDPDIEQGPPAWYRLVLPWGTGINDVRRESVDVNGNGILEADEKDLIGLSHPAGYTFYMDMDGNLKFFAAPMAPDPTYNGKLIGFLRMVPPNYDYASAVVEGLVQ